MIASPSKEQELIFSSFNNYKNTLINAGPGCAKSSSCFEIVLRNPTMKFLYLVFNNEAQKEAERNTRELKNVYCVTAHALAKRELGIDFEIANRKKLGQNVNFYSAINQRIGDLLNEDKELTTIFQKLGVDRFTVVSAVRRIIKYFEQSDKTAISSGFARRSVGVDLYLTGKITGMLNSSLIELERNILKDRSLPIEKRMIILDFVKRSVSVRGSIFNKVCQYPLEIRIWLADHVSKIEPQPYSDYNEGFDCLSEMAFDVFSISADLSNSFPITFDTMLKSYALSNPDLSKKYDVIIHDEGQDANRVMQDLVGKQKTTNIWVGDHNQSIYGFRGAVNTISELSKAQNTQVLPLTGSFRFTEEIAELANGYINLKKDLCKNVNESLLLNISSRAVAKEDGIKHILCRSNAGVVLAAIELIKEGHENISLGNAYRRDFFDIALNVVELKRGNIQNITHKSIEGFMGIDQLETDATLRDDRDLLTAIMVVNALEASGVELQDYVGKLKDITKVKPSEAAFFISTVHKVKGKEFDSVIIYHDFVPKFYSKDEGQYHLRSEIPEEEFNILYVAVTRAKRQVIFHGEAAMVKPEYLSVSG